MRVEDCTTCAQRGEVPGEGPRQRVVCPDCEGDGWIEVAERWDWWWDSRPGRFVARQQRRVRWVRQRWEERNADVVAAVVSAHRGVLDDQPRLRGLIENDLRQKLEGVTPLRWRQADVRWCWENTKRAARGQPMLRLPYEDVVEVSVSTEDRDLFEHDTVAILAEKRRRPRA